MISREPVVSEKANQVTLKAMLNRFLAKYNLHPGVCDFKNAVNHHCRNNNPLYAGDPSALKNIGRKKFCSAPDNKLGLICFIIIFLLFYEKLLTEWFGFIRLYIWTTPMIFVWFLRNLLHGNFTQVVIIYINVFNFYQNWL